MIGNAELMRLAQLLIIGSETARSISRVRGTDEDEINSIADRTVELAEQLELIAARTTARKSPIN